MRKSFKTLLITTFLCLTTSYSTFATSKEFYLQEDLNKDGIVDISDITLICQKYNQNFETYDLNKDSLIDIYDIAKLAQKYNQTSFGYGIVKAEELNVRSGPSTSSDILYKFKATDKFFIIDDLGEWYKIKYEDNGTIKDGYVYALYTLPLEDNYFNSFLGFLSSRYESTTYIGTEVNTVRDASVIVTNEGDEGGKSYGLYQLASAVGGVDNFLNWMKNNPTAVPFYTELQNAKIMDVNTYGVNFDASWKSISNSHYKEFFDLQRSFVKEYYYDYTATILKNRYGFDMKTKSFALREVLWSTAVQYGFEGDGTKTIGAIDIFYKAGLNNPEEDLIKNIYDIKIAHAEARNDIKTKERALAEKIDALMIYNN